MQKTSFPFPRYPLSGWGLASGEHHGDCYDYECSWCHLVVSLTVTGFPAPQSDREPINLGAYSQNGENPCLVRRAKSRVARVLRLVDA